MRSVRWRKAVRDLGSHPVRSVLVVLSIAVGVFAVGTIAGANAMLQTGLTTAYESSKPSSATIFAGPFDETSSTASARCRASPTRRRGAASPSASSTTTAHTARCSSPRSPTSTTSASTSSRRSPAAGRPTATRSSWSAARSSSQPFTPGQRLRVQTADGKEHDLTAIGLSHEVGAAPAFYAGRVAGPRDARDAPGPRLRHHLRRAPDQGRRPDPRPGRHPCGRRRRLARGSSGPAIPVFGSYVPVPGRHPANDLLQGFFLVLGFIGGLSLVVSGFPGRSTPCRRSSPSRRARSGS